MQCPLCPEQNRPDIPDLDKSMQHAIMVIRPDGAVHIHAPFGKPPVIQNFIEKFIIEAEKHGITYKPRVEGKGK